MRHASSFTRPHSPLPLAAWILSVSLALLTAGCTLQKGEESASKGVVAPADAKARDPERARQGHLWGWIQTTQPEKPAACLYLATIEAKEPIDRLFDIDTLARSSLVTPKAIPMAPLQAKMLREGQEGERATYANLAIYAICAAVGGTVASTSLGAGAIIIPTCVSLFGGYSIVSFLNGEPQVRAANKVAAVADDETRSYASWDDIDMIRTKAIAHVEKEGVAPCESASIIAPKVADARSARAAQP
jgi:hypothetical protein